MRRFYKGIWHIHIILFAYVPARKSVALTRAWILYKVTRNQLRHCIVFILPRCISNGCIDQQNYKKGFRTVILNVVHFQSKGLGNSGILSNFIMYGSVYGKKHAIDREIFDDKKSKIFHIQRHPVYKVIQVRKFKVDTIVAGPEILPDKWVNFMRSEHEYYGWVLSFMFHEIFNLSAGKIALVGVRLELKVIY